MLSFIQEFSSFNGKLRTNRWRRFVNVAYYLADMKRMECLPKMTDIGIARRFGETFHILKSEGVVCATRWFLIFMLYTIRGIMDTIHDKVESMTDCGAH